MRQALRPGNSIKLALGLLVAAAVAAHAGGTAVVKNGRFTNLYVYPNPSAETWDQHMARFRPADAAAFSRANIDRFTQELMAPVWPSYFDPLFQYNDISPPQFFGSAIVSQDCIDRAMKDLHNGVMQLDTIRSLSNCHVDGHDPSPQLNLIFSPDIKIGEITVLGTAGDLCLSKSNAWHSGGLNSPNFSALPTDPRCQPQFDNFTRAMSHETVEMLSDPALFGVGDLGQNEIGDNCQKLLGGNNRTTWRGFSVETYWSQFDRNCQPQLAPPPGSDSATWVLGQGTPLVRMTGDVHTLDLGLPANRVTTDAPLTSATLVIQTGGDDLDGGKGNADATLHLVGGNQLTANLNAGRAWGNGQTHSVALNLPAGSWKVSDITGVTLHTAFGGGLSGDNWNIDKVALIVGFPSGSLTHGPAAETVVDLIDASGAPLQRFTGDVHRLDLQAGTTNPALAVRALQLIVDTGNDDLRGGAHAQDNCDLTVNLSGNRSISLANVNASASWQGWTSHVVDIPLPPGGLSAGEILGVQLRTGFGGGIDGDNWNVERVQLKATVQPPGGGGMRRVYDAVWRPATAGEFHSYAMSPAQLQAKYDELWPQGFRLALLNTTVEDGQLRYDAVWRPGSTAEFQSWARTPEQYQQQYDQLWKQNFRIALLNTTVVNGQVRRDAVWRPGTTAEVQAYGRTQAQLQTQYDDLWKKNFRLFLLNPYVVNGQVLYDAVWRPGNSAEFQAYGRSPAELQAQYDQLWPKNFRLALLKTYVVNGQIRYDAVWRPGSTGEQQFYRLSPADFQKRYDALWPAGWRIVLLNTYEVAP